MQLQTKSIIMGIWINEQMGEENASSALQIMRHDAEEVLLESTPKDTQTEGTETGEQLAFRLFLEELKMSRAMFSSHSEESSISKSNHERNPRTINHDILQVPRTGDNSLTRQANIEHTTDYKSTKEAETSSYSGSNQSNNTRHCVACGEPKRLSDLAHTPCKHGYCSECINQMFEMAAEDENLFPPRCCGQQIPIEGNETLLDAGVLARFQTKAVEYTATHRTYCHRPECAAYIPPTSYVNDIAICGKCQEGTCLTCKGAAHDGECPHDEQLQQVMQLARDEKWQRCQNCKALVELEIGCNHMTCRCQHEFCYICGARWKTCTCEQWQEVRLLAHGRPLIPDDVAEQQARMRVAQILRDMQHHLDALLRTIQQRRILFASRLG